MSENTLVRTSPPICPITGGRRCLCPQEPAVSNVGRALLTDMRSAVRNVMMEHSMYTFLAITHHLPEVQPGAAEVIVERLMRNPRDIAQLIVPIVGPELASSVERVIRTHLELAAATFEPLRRVSTVQINAAVDRFMEQGEEFATALHALNIRKIPLDIARNLVKQHNTFVVQLASLRSQGNHERYVALFDDYIGHTQRFADALYEGLLM